MTGLNEPVFGARTVSLSDANRRQTGANHCRHPVQAQKTQINMILLPPALILMRN
jgi:hypothetical protein